MKKKILIFINSIDVGGVRNVLISSLNSLDYTKYDVSVVSIFQTAELESLLIDNVKCKILCPFTIRGYSHIFKLINPKIIYRLFIKERYDVEIACMDGIAARVISGSKNKESKKILWIHSDISTNKATNHCFKNVEERKKIYNIFDMLWFVSNGSRDGFVKELGELGKRREVLYNPFNISQMIGKSNEEINDFSKNDYFTFCTVGRLSKEKSFDMLIKAFRKVNLTNNKTRLLIIGNGEEYAFLKKLIKINNMEKNVFLLGEKANPLPYVKMSDCYVCSSKTEALSTSVIEATIVGIPTVTTNCSGMSDILGESEYGLIVDYKELANGMSEMINNKELYDNYKKKIITRKSVFSQKVFKEKFELMI